MLHLEREFRNFFICKNKQKEFPLFKRKIIIVKETNTNITPKISDNINRYVILQAMNELPDQFCTKDILENVNVINAHPKLYKHTHYHAFIGKLLKINFMIMTVVRC